MTYYQARERLGVMLTKASSEADKEALRVARGRLLKAMEDEPVEPVAVIDDDGYVHEACPKCRSAVDWMDNYCWSCGAEFEWE